MCVKVGYREGLVGGEVELGILFLVGFVYIWFFAKNRFKNVIVSSKLNFSENIVF